MLKEKIRNRKGFTLIEIIVVIVILAVLMAVAVPSVMSYMSEGNKAKYESVARAALINTQTAVAEDLAKDGTLNQFGTVQYWVDNIKVLDEETYGKPKSYGNAKIYVSEIHTNSSKDDVTSAVYYISIKGTSTALRKVSVNINGKVTVADGCYNGAIPVAKNYNQAA